MSGYAAASAALRAFERWLAPMVAEVEAAMNQMARELVKVHFPMPHPDAVAFVAAILAGELEAAGAFADWLEEHDDPRGVLLRRRWKAWSKRRNDLAAVRKSQEELFGRPWLDLLKSLAAINAYTELRTRVELSDGGERRCDASFRVYVRERFAGEAMQPLADAIGRLPT